VVANPDARSMMIDFIPAGNWRIIAAAIRLPSEERLIPWAYRKGKGGGWSVVGTYEMPVRFTAVRMN
jgi:hypothetical protein